MKAVFLDANVLYVIAKDVPVLASAAMAHADLLVTLDRGHFGRLYGRTVGGVTVITPRELAAIIP